jgi:hypothetical protein
VFIVPRIVNNLSHSQRIHPITSRFLWCYNIIDERVEQSSYCCVALFKYLPSSTPFQDMLLPLRSLQSVKTFLFLLLRSQCFVVISRGAPAYWQSQSLSSWRSRCQAECERIKDIVFGKALFYPNSIRFRGHGIVVQDVHAPVDAVWGEILDFDHYGYCKMVPKTAESESYKTNPGARMKVVNYG